MSTKHICYFLLAVMLIFSGCAAPKKWVSEPEFREADNPFCRIKVSVLPSASGTFLNAFEVELVNKTNAGLIIDWNRSHYLYNGKTAGMFVFKDIQPESIRDKSVPPDTVLPGSTFTKTIAPYRLVAKAPAREPRKDVTESDFSFGPLPAGENGVHLAIRQNGETSNETITFTIQEVSAP